MVEPVSCLIPTRRHVCIPGDAVLLLRGRNAVVTLGNGLHPLRILLPEKSNVLTNNKLESNADECNSKLQKEYDNKASGIVVMAEYCAPLQMNLSAARTSVPKYFLECPANKRYLNPRLHDPVVAIVVKNLGSQYVQCYINSIGMAIMSTLAFDGASKSNRPRLKEGDVLYAYISALPSSTSITNLDLMNECVIDEEDADITTENWNSDTKYVTNNLKTCMEREQKEINVGYNKTSYRNYTSQIELSCEAGLIGFAAKDWNSKEAIFGPLQSGQLLTIPLSYADSLLAPLPAHLLSRLHNRDYSVKRRKRNNKRQRCDDDENKCIIDCGTDATNINKEITILNKDSCKTCIREEAPASYLIALLGQQVSFELCVGKNGYCWVKATTLPLQSSTTTTIAKQNSNTNVNNIDRTNTVECNREEVMKSAHNKEITASEMKINVALSACINEACYDVTIEDIETRVESYFSI